ncbi:MAG: 3-dehydroquinate synthase [Ruminococcus sp.]|nr:3-dehydroquinate synthase [Ruminococcus sp.]
MKIVEINASQSYNVYIEQGLLTNCGDIIRGVCSGRKCVVISDSNVAPLYADTLINHLNVTGFETELFVIEAGEESKNPENLVKAADFLVECELTRSDVLVALGGGVITDLCGLCGALYQRGVAVVQIPTSLLAMVDSSVGGKTAVNLKSGKNMFGAFYQPKAVICDSALLQTLPPEEFSNGMAEVIKYAVLRGGRVLEIINENTENNLDELLYECVKIKCDYVCADEFDKGVRQFLNLGHTVGHAIERVSNFATAHGSAVAQGMCIMAKACEKAELCEKDTVSKIKNLCKKFGLPTESKYSVKELYTASLSDKKRDSDEITVVMIRGFGDCILEKMKTDSLKDLIKNGIGD